jgi:4-amino-4-deoxy-L-arabinose transferase-like glycosyltransferase
MAGTVVGVSRPRRLSSAYVRGAVATGVPIVVAALLNLWSLDTNGYGNAFYSAAVRSMSGSWHAFLYNSFDPARVMTVDKPPLALWVQSLSVRAFGLSPWSILVPQAVMGVATVALVYDLTRRRFGRTSGSVAGLVLALTPVSVAIWRDNNTDALLVLCCVTAVWLAVRGLEDGRTRWVVLSGVAIGLGFETKMAAALLVVPALAGAWLWVAPRGIAAAVRSLFAGGVAMVAVAGAWPLLVALTPVGARPWISGTNDNSPWSLVFGYNGAGRLVGQEGGPGARGVHGGPFGGHSGPLRLLDLSLGGQAGWLLAFALVAGVGIVLSSRLRRGDPRTGWIIAVGGSFATIAAAFSAAHGIFHPYYVSLLAPFTALLTGAGPALFRRAGPLARVIAPLALAAGVVCQVAILNDHPAELAWLPALLVGVGGGAAVLVAVADQRQVRSAALAGAVAVLLIAPAVWSYDTVGHPANGTFPMGGPTTRPAQSGGRPHRAIRRIESALAYVRRHGGGTLAVSRQGGATADIMIRTGAPLAGTGGFSGRESHMSLAWFAAAVERGQIRWVFVGGPGRCGGRDGRIGSGTVMWAVRRAGVRTRVHGLYSVSGRARALRALRPPTCAPA